MTKNLDPLLLRTVHVVDANAHSPPVSFQLLDLGELHDGLSHIPQPLRRQVRARDVLDERAQVDARVLLRIAVCSCLFF